MARNPRGSAAGRSVKSAGLLLRLFGPEGFAVFLIGGLLVVVLLLGVGVAFVGSVFSPGSSGTAVGSGGIKAGTVPAEYVALYEAAGQTCPEISPAFLAAQGKAESGFDPRAASRGDDGRIIAEGISQFTRATAAQYGLANPYDPAQAIPAQGRMMCELVQKLSRFPGDKQELALAGYNAGPYAVINAGGIPNIRGVRAYIKRVAEYKAEIEAPSVVTALVGGAPLARAADGSWGGFQNGRIPASVLCPIPWDQGERLHCDATAALTQLNVAYRAEFGVDIAITDAYRDYAGQVSVRASKPGLAARPGTSQHGWALAGDLGGGINRFGTEQYAWMKANAPAYGWTHPSWAEPGGSKPEAWHWEYVGG